MSVQLRDRVFLAAWLVALAGALLTIVLHFGYFHFPLAFLLLGFISWRLHQGRAFLLFAFLAPLVNSLPALLSTDLPFNYSAPLLFYLSGLVLGLLSRRLLPVFDFSWSRAWLFFLLLLLGSALLTLARWSNIGLSTLALFRDTPVNGVGDRFAYAVIFPVITLFLAAAAPFAAALARESGLKMDAVWRALSLGFLLSCLLGLLQRFLWPGFLSQSWWVTEHGHVNGGFSDFNGFGFCAGLLFLYHAGKLLWPDLEAASAIRAGRENLFFLVLSLGGVFLSGSRTAFFFVLVAAAGLFFSSRFSGRQKTLLAVAGLLLILLAGGTLRDRLLGNVQLIGQSWRQGNLVETLDRFSNGRITMARNSAAMIGDRPLSGIGAGNYLMQLRHEKRNETRPLLDLPLNQYLLAAAELGLVGLLVFIVFLARAFSAGGSRGLKVMLAAVMAAFLFGTPLWLPEGAVFFWLLLAASAKAGPKPPAVKSRLAAGLVLGLFLLAAVLSWSGLHPLNLSRQTGNPYDYGFWYQEKDTKGRDFNWSGAAAGFFLQLDSQGRAPGLHLVAEAPFSRLPGGEQQVSLYWRGRLWRRLVFSAPTVMTLDLQAEPGTAGFFEIRVQPAFNLKEMGLGPEGRTLGVKVYRP